MSYSFLRPQQQLMPRKCSYTKTIDLHHRFHYHLNLVKDALRPMVSDKLCVSDITYLPTHQSTVYLSLFTDAYSRRIVGHHVHASLHTISWRRWTEPCAVPAGPLRAASTHSDRGRIR